MEGGNRIREQQKTGKIHKSILVVFFPTFISESINRSFSSTFGSPPFSRTENYSRNDSRCAHKITFTFQLESEKRYITNIYNQSFCLFVRWGPRGQEPSRFVILSSGQCVISAASGEEVCPLPTTELTCPKEERIRVLMKKSEYFSKIWTTL